MIKLFIKPLSAFIGFTVYLLTESITLGTATSTITSISSSSSLFVPTRISYEQLVNYAEGKEENDDDDDIFWKTLHKVGLISITDVPNLNKNNMLKELQDCLDHRDGNNFAGAPDFAIDDNNSKNDDDDDDDDVDSNYRRHRRRRTLATRTLAGQQEGIFVATKQHNNNKNNDNDNSKCIGLQTSTQKFRQAVQKVTNAFAARLEDGINTKGTNKTVLKNKIGNDTEEEEEEEGLTIERVINEGEHLEHFHSYYSASFGATQATATATADSTPSPTTTTLAIDWHTDQGLVLIFTPGQRDGVTTNGFFIQLQDGSTVEIDFDSNLDDLVIMLGDGVNQYVNPYLSSSLSLRTVPHALTLPKTTSITTTDNESSSSSPSPRLWYGRMVLPPPTAIHPVGNGFTFREMRELMIRGDDSALHVGCASQHMIARELMIRELGANATTTSSSSGSGSSDGDGDGDENDVQCDDDISILCWMRCMSYTDWDVDQTTCKGKGDDYNIECANKDGLLWQKGIHSQDYYLRCLSTDNSSDDEQSISDTTEVAQADSSNAYHVDSVFRVVTATTAGLVALLCGSIVLA